MDLLELRKLIYRTRLAYSAWQEERKLYSKFYGQLETYNKMAHPDRQAGKQDLFPCLFDATAETQVNGLYLLQDTWAFERIVRNKPAGHVDVGSSNWFVGFLSKVVPVTMIDIRPLSIVLNTIDFKKGSILELPYPDESVESVSSLCVVEHIGLGRYGDDLDPEGTEKSLHELKRVLRRNGRLYLSIPVGTENKVAFNAGRILALDYLYKLLEPLRIVNQAFIVNDRLQDKFEQTENFGTTILLELQK